MAESLSRLLAEIPPPSEPQGVSRSWMDLEQELRMVFPQDYMRFIKAYGSGGFFPFELFISNLLDYQVDAHFITGQNEFADDAENREVSLLDFSQSTPIFPFGSDTVSSTFFWAQVEDPDEWYVIVVKGGREFYKFPDLSLTDFLVALFLDRDPKLTALWADDGSLDGQTFVAAPKR